MQGFEIRNDDVLLTAPLTRRQVLAKRQKSFFDYFKEADQFFEENNIPTILAVVADGIGVYPKWEEYIKERIHRFRIELHCLHHENYQNLSEEEGYAHLKEAKDRIETAFNTKVTQWYPVSSTRGYPEWSKRVCERLGVSFHATESSNYHLYFHYWNPKSVEKIKKYVLSH